MIDKTRWLGLGPWHEDNESELIDWTAQPQYKGCRFVGNVSVGF